MLQVALSKAQAHWCNKQHIDGDLRTPAEAIAQTGWLRTLGGIEAYLALRGRIADFVPADLDVALQSGDVQIVPAVRGCIYIVPRQDVPLAMQLADRLYKKRALRDFDKAGCTEEEILALADTAVAALGDGPLSTLQLRKALPDGAARSLGERGKKVGLSSTLPSALRYAEFAGRVERRTVTGRADSERYVWQATTQHPLKTDRVSDDPIAQAALLADRFFRWAGPATRKEFAEWAGISQGEAKKGIAAAKLITVSVADYADEAFVHADEVDTLLAAQPAGVPRAALLPFEDNTVAFRRIAFVTDPAVHGLEVRRWGIGSQTVADCRWLFGRAVIVGDLLAGMWEWDPSKQRVDFAGFSGLNDEIRRDLARQAEQIGGWIRDDFGHAKSVSIDSDKSLVKRSAFIRTLPGYAVVP